MIASLNIVMSEMLIIAATYGSMGGVRRSAVGPTESISGAASCESNEKPADCHTQFLGCEV